MVYMFWRGGEGGGEVELILLSRWGVGTAWKFKISKGTSYKDCHKDPIHKFSSS